MCTRWILIALLGVCACGGDDSGDGTSDETDGMTPDGRVMTTGFEKPQGVMKANTNNAEVGPVDLGCLGTATNVVPTTTAVTLTAKVVDFQRRTSGGDREPIPDAAVTAFAGIDTTTPFGAVATSGADGNVTVTIPAGTKLFGFKMTKSSALDTLLINQFLADATTPTQTYEEIRLISKLTADTLPAIIGIEAGRTPGTGMVAGAIRDCQGREISNFIATVSTTPTTATIPDDQLSFYFSTAATPLPTVHSQNPDGSPSGLFLVLDVPPAPTGYVQVWGYATQADLDSDTLTLVAELAVPVIADTVVTGSYRPRRTGE